MAPGGSPRGGGVGSGAEVRNECGHALIDFVAEGSHGVEVVAGEGQLPMELPSGGAWQDRADGLAAHRDHEVDVGQQLGGNGCQLPRLP